MKDLSGAKVVLLEARMNSELANLVRRHGGEPVSVPAVREATTDCGPEVAALIDALAAGEVEYIVFQTGVGVSTLVAEAEKLGRRDDLLAALQRTGIVARGPKPTAVLSRLGLKPTASAQEPFTTADLIAAMQPLDLAGKTAAVLHYGERNAALVNALAARGARLHELTLYEWLLPADTAPLTRLVEEIIAGDFTAVAFTSQIQARHLFQLAAAAGKDAALRDALNQRTVVASVGPTCTAALQTLGVTPRLEPEHPKMGAMVVALADYLQHNQQL